MCFGNFKENEEPPQNNNLILGSRSRDLKFISTKDFPPTGQTSTPDKVC